MSFKNRKRKKIRLKARIRLYSMENLHKQSNNRATFFIYQTLTMLVILVLIVQAFRGRYENCFTCGLTLILFLIPNFVESRLKITLPQTLEIIIILFIFSAEILGEISAFYIKFHWWDLMLHAMNGFLMAAIGFSMVDILNKNDRFKFKLSPVFMAIVSFCFSMTVGVLWEFFEFFMDSIFSTDMQKDIILSSISSVDLNLNRLNVPVIVEGIENIIVAGKNLTIDGVAANDGFYSLGMGGYLDIGLIDTMEDLIVNFIGAVVFSIFGYFYIKSRGKGVFVEKFIPKLKNEEMNNQHKNSAD